MADVEIVVQMGLITVGHHFKLSDTSNLFSFFPH